MGGPRAEGVSSQEESCYLSLLYCDATSLRNYSHLLISGSFSSLLTLSCAPSVSQTLTCGSDELGFSVREDVGCEQRPCVLGTRLLIPLSKSHLLEISN